MEPVRSDVRRRNQKRRLQLRQLTQWRWHLDEVYVGINGETHYLWRAVDHEGEVLSPSDQDPGSQGSPEADEAPDEALRPPR